MMFANVNEVVHFLLGFRRRKLAREQEAQIEDGAHPAERYPPPCPHHLTEPSGSHVSSKFPRISQYGKHAKL